MRTVRIAAATVMTAALFGAVPSHADDGAGGAWLYIKPVVRKSTVDFTSWASATGTTLGTYVVRFTIKGAIVGPGHHVVIADWWSQASTKPGASRPAHHVYSTSGADVVTLLYTGELLAPGSGVPAVICQSVLTIVGDDAPQVRGTC